MTSTDGDGFQPVKSADRTLEILETLADSGGRPTLAELATTLDIPKSSLHAILRTMQRRRWIETDASGLRFGLGVRAVEVGTSYVDADDVVARLGPMLDELAEVLGETVHLGRLDGPDIVYIAKRESRHPLRLYSAIGRRLPAHATALGKAILATQSTQEVDRLLVYPLLRLTPNTLTDPTELHTDLEATRARGYAIDREENTEGIRCFAVAVATNATEIPDAISLSVPTFRLDDDRQERMVEALLAARARAKAAPSLRRS
ncbi:MAG: IclR family transcriptional regulator [Acidimicrobiales bacterium]